MLKKLASVLTLVCAMGTAALAQDPSELVFIFQKQKDPAKIQSDADKVAAFVGKEVGLPVKAVVPGDYSASVQALVSKKADFAYVSSMPFLLARRDGGATLLLAEVRKGADGVEKTNYNSIFVVPKDSKLQSVADLVKDAKQQRMVFTSPTSTSGYLMAYSRLVNEGLLKPKQDPREVFASVAFGGGYTQALEQLLAGRGDVAAVSDYVLEGPRVDTYLKPEQREKLRILDRTPGVPTHLIAARAGLSDGLKAKMKAALMKLATEQPEVLADVYGATKFAEVNEDEHVKKAIEAVEQSGVAIEGLAK
jgi:phosphonate transport system substrate-binding protein